MSKPLYRSYSDYLKQKYGEKVYKIPVNLAGSCPNRDGKISSGGCIFCDEEGAGFQCLPNSLSVEEQIKANKEFFSQRFNANKFIVYFQSFTNTYLPTDRFEQHLLEAVSLDDIVGISISTRPDCIDSRYLDILQKICDAHKIDINVELGLQTVNYHTLQKINRGHTLAEFIDAVYRIKKYHFEICAHIILNLPWDNLTDVIESAKILSALGVDHVKLHSLYIVKNTVLGQMYQNKEFEVIPLDEYVNRVITFLEYLDPNIVIQRLVGKGPINGNLFCNWNTSWWLIKQKIERKMKDLNTYQGKKFDYLNKRWF
ncbi:TIGR01212 family radical SAM protein [Peptococcaceae bacterium]|nr:TIGR01212 family radical SAM protein [Peptococcaceae bacterium]